MRDLISQLVACDGPAGYEKNVRNLIRENAVPYADEIRADALGNLLVRKGQKSANGLRIMLAAHMDEIGLMASHITEDGFVRISNLGAVHGVYAVGQRVHFLNGVKGVIGHEFEDFSSDKVSLEKLFVDVGAATAADCPVQVGDTAVFDSRFEELNGRWTGKALDDRVSVAALLEILRRFKAGPHEVWFVFTVMEESGRRGAGPAAFGIDPDLAIALDVITAGDTPKGFRVPIEMGNGPVLKMLDARLIADPQLMQVIEKTAAQIGIAMQRGVIKRGATDGSMIQLVREGVPTANLGIPARYIHSPVEMVDPRDAEKVVTLLLRFLENPVEIS